ncbi:MAG: L-fucokinase [Phycisphaeraceae bacterium]
MSGFAVPASFEEGSRHGVFVFDRLQQGVTGYLQKAPIDDLRTRAALPGGNQCALDIGIVAFDRLGRERLRTLAERFGGAVARGEVYIDLYVEILTAALDGISDDEYEDLVSTQSRMSREDRAAVREIMRGSALQGVLGRRSTFLHYGSIGEVPETAAALAKSGEIVPFYDVPVAAGLAHELPPTARGGVTVHDSWDVSVSADGGDGAPSLVDSSRGFAARLGGANLVTSVDRVALPGVVPPGICLDGRALSGSGEVVAVYHRDDTFKAGEGEARVCGEDLAAWLAARGLSQDDLGLPDADEGTATLWGLPLWPELPADGSPEARGSLIAAFWNPELADDGWRTWFLGSPRHTLRSLTDAADLTTREGRRSAIRAGLLRDTVLDGRGWQAIPAAEAHAIFTSDDRASLQELTTAEPDELIRSYRGRFVAELGHKGRTAAQRGTIPTPMEPAESASSIQIPYSPASPRLRRCTVV